MNTFLRLMALVALMSVCGVRHVSGFAPADTPQEREPLRSSQVAARVYVAARSATFDHVDGAPNLIVGSVHEPLIVEMLGALTDLPPPVRAPRRRYELDRARPQ